MVMLSWNVQGIGRPLTFQILQGLCIVHRPLVVFLMETKNKRDTLELIRSLHFQNSSYVDPKGIAGGLALWWTDEVILDVRYKTKNLMKCVVSWPRMKNPWLVTFVYAPPVWNQRVAFWNVLKGIAKENGYPWLCVGDLNEIGSSAEKQGGNRCSQGRGEDNIIIRLDRALADVEWSNLFPLAQVLHEVVAKEWEHQHRGSDMYGLVQRLKCCKNALLGWSKRTFGKDKLRLKVLQEKLKGIQTEPYSQARFEQEKEYVKEVEILLLREEMMLHQRSRINWLSYGDRNSAFFHASINQRRQRNQMVKLRTSRGEWIESEEGINGIIKDFFSGLFSHSGQRDFSEALSVVNSCITEDMNARLIKEVTEEEIKLAAFQLGSLKAPGPDGYLGFFFQYYWSTVGEGLCKAVQRFFTSGYILKELNQTNIVLIPKKIISPNQSAFVPGRLIQDNVLVAHEAFHFLKLKKKGGDGYMGLKLDFNKAYDRVEWDFIEDLLKKMGFHVKWVMWIMQSLPSSFAYFFADDALLFLKADLQNCSRIKSILNVYGEASGQCINFDKSGIFFSSNLSDVDKQLCCDFMEVPLMKLDSKYLGLPSFWGKSKAEAYSFIIEKVLNKMQGWKVKKMSLGGKEIMLKSVVQAIPSYAMSCFLLPKKTV
ncbi:uncharacterized protein LOC131298548 [Rhododendron vialii]|uniref:uncharacterized protein LOC131298548 n=1 Tax=Rhododendron vialii TaxID=182163 RepID=UPI00265E66E9|nr:uncharacterized protein LOC131298548 [Rhododendron vialii]